MVMGTVVFVTIVMHSHGDMNLGMMTFQVKVEKGNLPAMAFRIDNKIKYSQTSSFLANLVPGKYGQSCCQSLYFRWLKPSAP